MDDALPHPRDRPAPALVDALRVACASVAARARHVVVVEEAVEGYAAALAPELGAAPTLDPDLHLLDAPRAERAAFFLTLDAINFGSGWFPVLAKRPGRSGYETVALGLRERFAAHGAWSPAQLARMEAAEIAPPLGQDPAHELMALFAASLRDLGARVEAGGFAGVVTATGGSAVALVERLAHWDCFADFSTYDGLRVPFLKRAQLAAADLALAGAVRFADLHRLTMFADNLVPHVLRLDGILRFDAELVARIDRGEPLAHGSRPEVEIRACALHAVERIVAASGGPAVTGQRVDQFLWNRGRQPRYKAVPRHRSRCTAY